MKIKQSWVVYMLQVLVLTILHMLNEDTFSDTTGILY
jgi:hypothetical protein